MASTINELIRKTLSLQKTLKQLVKDFSEEGLPADERIFNRILTNDWRLPMDQESRHDERYVRAVGWVKAFHDYIRQLREYCFYELGEQDRFSTIPLNGNQRASAEECLRLLPLQHRILRRWKNSEGKQKEQAKANGDGPLRSQLKRLVDTNGTKAAAAAMHCNRDTLEDFLAGKTKPRKKTVQLFQQYVLANKAFVKK